MALVCALALVSSLYNPARRPAFIKTPRLLGSMPSYVPLLIPLLYSHYPSPVSISFSPSFWSSRSASHKSSLFMLFSCFLPTSVVSMNRRTAVVASSLNKIAMSIQSLLEQIVSLSELSLCSIASRSLRHFRHSSMRCTTVCLPWPHHRHRAS
jgi:hypothetical protein